MSTIGVGLDIVEISRVERLIASKGDVTVFFTSPFSVFFLFLSAVSIVWPFLSERRKSKAAALPAT